jgi:two-component system response regulator AlgR
MPGRDGIDVAAALASQAEAPAVVFCTAYDEYALQALNQQAMAYLLKPVREEDLERALASAVRVNRAQLAALRDDAPGRAEITSSGHSSVQTLPVADIRCFVAEDKYLRAVAPQGEMLISEALKDLEQEFGGRFLRVHRNALVRARAPDAPAPQRRCLGRRAGWGFRGTGGQPSAPGQAEGRAR